MQPELSRSKQTFGLWPWIKEEKVLVLLCNARRNLNLALKPAEFFLAVRELEGLWEKLFTTDLKVYFYLESCYITVYTQEIFVFIVLKPFESRSRIRHPTDDFFRCLEFWLENSLNSCTTELINNSIFVVRW